MKKMALTSALFASVCAFGASHNYEITPMAGYVINENNIGINNHTAFGAEIQRNNLGSTLAPELAVFYSPAEYANGQKVDIFRTTISGVYEYDKLGFLVPLAKIGIGYENLDEQILGNTDGIFFDVALGAKVPMTKAIALKLEAIYMPKYNDTRWDSNLALMAGINFAFGEVAQKEAPKPEPKKVEAPKPVVVAAPVVVAPVIIDGDDDKDGVKNSKDKCPTSKMGEKVNVEGCFVDGDDDKDGVLNLQDKCPASKMGEKVDAMGCAVVVDGDDDKDSVLNSKDKCSNTPVGAPVNVDGCVEKIDLHVTFDTGSYNVSATSKENIAKFATYLKFSPNYNVSINGYTDNVGNDKLNQKLSEKRAKIVADMIVAEGVGASRVSHKGLGESAPIATNDTKEGRAQNRRIEAELTKAN